MEGVDDISKKKLEKIAAARKKLKQYQSKTPKGKETANFETSNDEAEVSTNIEQSSTFDIMNPIAQQQETNPIVQPISSYFSNSSHDLGTNEQRDEIESNRSTFNDPFDHFNTINFSSSSNVGGETTNQPSGLTLQNYFQQESNFSDFLSGIGSKNVSAADDLMTSNPIETFTPQQQQFFNMLSLPENNSETISTISERTENDSSLGGGGIGQANGTDLGDMESDMKSVTPNETLNQLSAQMSAMLMTDDATNRDEETSPNLYSLEQKIQELQIMYQSEKIRNEELNFKLKDQSKQLEERQMELQKLQYERTTSVGIDVRNLQEQLENHIKTVGILVGEKTELTSSLNKSQSLIKEKNVEVEELQSRLSASRHKVQELEKELNQNRTSCERLSDSQQKLVNELEQLQDQMQKASLEHRDTVEELEVLNQKLSSKSTEITQLKGDLSKKSSEVNLLQLRIEQLTSGTDINAIDAPKLTELTRANENYEKQLSDYQKLIEQMRTEKDQSDLYYQGYLTQLNTEMSNLSGRLQEINDEKEKLKQREQNLVQHVGELEKNLQQQMAANRHLAEQQSQPQVETVVSTQSVREEEFKRSTDRISELERQNLDYMNDLADKRMKFEQIITEMNEKTNHISQLEMTVERLQANRPDPTNLMASIESDRLAASRAVSQNVELKNQLEELQKAFVQLSNDKLELTDKLQSEQHLCREMKVRYDEMESELIGIREKFDNKDAEMIRLAGENSELDKQILQQSQELDRLRHYESRNHFGTVLQTELQNSNDQIAYLRSRIKEMETQRRKSIESDGHPENIEGDAVEVTEESANEEEQLLSTSNFMIASHDAMEKLQERFRRTMDEIADLTEEKQKLEHLVMQLQSETETIGEYVALYQQQRRLLKQREIEKDFELQKLAEDREMLKHKLTYFNSLIEQFLLEKGVNPPANILNNGHHDDINSGDHHNHSHQVGHHHHSHMPDQLNERSPIQYHSSKSSGDQTNETAVKILNLLEEIKVVNNNMGSLQHCSCCSGKLETV